MKPYLSFITLSVITMGAISHQAIAQETFAQDAKLGAPINADRTEFIRPIKPIRPSPSKPIDFKEIKCKSNYSAPLVNYKNKYEVVTDPHRFLDLYLQTDNNSQEPAPVIDFDTTTVIALLPQPRPNPSYGIRVSHVDETIKSINVNVEYYNYISDDWAVIQVVHYPYCFYAIPKSKKRILFTETENTYQI